MGKSGSGKVVTERVRKKAKRKVPSFKKDKIGKKRKVRRASSGNLWQWGVEKTG
jgi:hypothetical protein